MAIRRAWVAAGACTAVLLGSLVAVPAGAGEVRKVEAGLFTVTLTDASGTTQDFFPPGEDMVFNLRFGLALSDVSDYQVTATVEVGGASIEAYNGKLAEGIWQLTHPVKVMSNWGSQAPWKVILKVRMFNRAASGTTSWYAYRTAEGKVKIGYR